MIQARRLSNARHDASRSSGQALLDGSAFDGRDARASGTGKKNDNNINYFSGLPHLC
ncbi:hypothetical protein MKK75_23120 [Methylobacterium sp. J-030]|uniref:hypothetical protein n=1 Tax=Methylobacterium sp. J-030 TaxID=2836627 RepID=UPI001FB8A1F4|nr:hypothetical protein [Methylobacterium sp. J-030]MCJ2071656.1 hypothetical protein [Methylobacterium sp. J-030]